MKNLLQSSARDRRTECSIALGAISIWLINGLYHRPDSRFNELAQQACQLVPLDYDNYDEDLDEEEDCAPLMYEAGLYFICDIAIDRSGTYRIPYHKTFSEEAIVAAFRLSLREIREVLGITQITHIRIKANVERSNNRTRKRTIRVDDARDQHRPLPQIQNENLQDLQFRPAQRMRGDDVNHFARHGGGNRIQGQNNINPANQEEDMGIRIQKLLEQFFYDLIQQAPNRKAAKDGSWTNIPVSMRLEEGTEQLYKSLALPFYAAQYIFCDAETWKKHFDRFFPLEIPSRIGQNFGQTSYYAQWLELVNSLSTQSLARVRQTIKVKFDTLLWVPSTQYDRIWCTSANYSRGWYMLPRNQHPSGPQIALNPKARNRRYGHPSLRAPPIQQDSDDEQSNDGQGNQEEEPRNGSIARQQASNHSEEELSEDGEDQQQDEDAEAHRHVVQRQRSEELPLWQLYEDEEPQNEIAGREEQDQVPDLDLFGDWQAEPNMGNFHMVSYLLYQHTFNMLIFLAIEIFSITQYSPTFA